MATISETRMLDEEMMTAEEIFEPQTNSVRGRVSSVMF